MIQLSVLKDASEIIHYNVPQFLAYCRDAELAYFPDKSALCHWHDDLEFTMAVKGSMMYSVNGKDFQINEGEGILINAKKLHYGYSVNGADCKFTCILLHPKLICSNSYIERKFVEPILDHPAFDQMILRPSDAVGSNLLKYYLAIHEANSIKEPGYELEIQSLFNSIWKQIYKIYSSIENTSGDSLDNNLLIQKNMISFINNNYMNKISLREIAASGGVCRSKCCAIFKTYLHQSPIGYLNRYRLERSIEHLITSSASITEIALSSGFTGSSYFTEIFRQYKGCTPTEYRVIAKRSRDIRV